MYPLSKRRKIWRAEDGNYFDILDDNVVGVIFSYLIRWEEFRALSVCKVCRRWNTLMNNPQRWKYVNISHFRDKIKVQDFAKLLSRFPLVEHLDLGFEGKPDMRWKGDKFNSSELLNTTSLTKLKKLDLADRQTSGNTLVSLLSKAPNLEILKLRGSPLMINNQEFDMIGLLPKLKQLFLTNEIVYFTQSQSTLPSGSLDSTLEKLSNLDSLVIEYLDKSFSEKSVSIILSTCLQLNRLCLKMSKMAIHSWVVDRPLPCLTQVKLHAVSFDDNSVASLIRNSPQLCKLHLSELVRKADPMKLLIPCQALTDLELDGLAITDSVCQHICTIYPQLLSLGLSSTNEPMLISNDAISYISQLEILESLYLGSSLITSVEPLSQLHNLHFLRLEFCEKLQTCGFSRETSIKGLSLYCTATTDNGLINIRQFSPELKTLFVDRCPKISGRGLADFLENSGTWHLKVEECSVKELVLQKTSSILFLQITSPTLTRRMMKHLGQMCPLANCEFEKSGFNGFTVQMDFRGVQKLSLKQEDIQSGRELQKALTRLAPFYWKMDFN